MGTYGSVGARGEQSPRATWPDGGQYQPFVDFVVRRCLDAMQLVNECALAADSPGMDQQLSNLNQAYTTGSGFSQEEIDGAGVALIELAGEAFSKLIGIKKAELGKIELKSNPVQTGTRPREEGFRIPQAAKPVQIAGSSPVPLSAAASRIFDVLVPVDCGSDDDLRVVELGSAGRYKLAFEARIDELLPTPSAALQVRLDIFAERQITGVLGMLSEKLSKQ